VIEGTEFGSTTEVFFLGPGGYDRKMDVDEVKDDTGLIKSLFLVTAVNAS